VIVWVVQTEQRTTAARRLSARYAAGASPGEVLVKVEAAGVGPWDGWIRAGKSALPQPLPVTLGSDLSGEVVAVESGDLRVGDQVYGVTNPQFIGAYAEYALASAAMVSRKPTSLTHIEAASVPVIAVTAWQALFDQAQLKAGQTVVIHGAAGNVGAYAVQLARRADVRIIATAATDDILFLRNLGANTVIDYKTQRFEEEVRDADAVIDLVGGETQKRSFQVLHRGGKLISAVSPHLISILRKAVASKPGSFWSTSQPSIWRR
jgi:NADPH:quinone reductase-like Zn-dependent oxidoreductase